MTTTYHLNVRTALNLTKAKGRNSANCATPYGKATKPNFILERDSFREQRTKPLPTQIHRRGNVRGSIDCYLVGMMALLAVVILLIAGGLVHG